MPNTIALAKNYASLLDEVYKTASVTNGLTSPAATVRAGSMANTIVYPQITTGGLGNYDRNSGYTSANVNVKWVEAAFNYDRGAKIMVDAMDNEESRNIAFGQAAATLMRTQVAPEADAFTFAKIAGTSGISSGAAADIADGAALLEALYEATVKMDEDEVPAVGRQLYITPTLHKSIAKLDTTKSREILGYFSVITEVPQTRFYTGITLSATDGFAEATGAYKLNFVVADPSALIKSDKHVVSDVIPAAQNPDADADIVKYRKYGIVEVFGNKKAGIYISHATTAKA